MSALNLKSLLSEVFLDYVQYFPFKKGKYRAASIASYILDGSVITSIYGPKLRARFKDSTFWLMARYGNESCYNHLKDLNSNDVFIDVGANIGLFTVIASQHCYKVIALEPSTREFLDLIQNISLNSCDNVIPILAAAADKVSFGELNVNNIVHSGGNSVVTNTKQVLDKEKTQAIHMTTIDYLIDAYYEYLRMDNVSKNDPCKSFVVKIDVEGFEPQVLVGMEASLSSQKIRKVVVEIDHERAKMLGFSDFDIYGYMESYNFVPTLKSKENHYDECFTLA